MCDILITTACVLCIKTCFLWTSDAQYIIILLHSLALVEWSGYWGDRVMRECGNQIPACFRNTPSWQLCWWWYVGPQFADVTSHTHTHTHTHWIFAVVMWIYRSHSEPQQLWRQMFQIKKTVLGRNALETWSTALPANIVSRGRFSWPGTDEIPTIPPCDLSPPLRYTTNTTHSRHVGFIVLLAECPFRIQQEVSSFAISIFVPLSSLSPVSLSIPFILLACLHSKCILISVVELVPKRFGSLTPFVFEK